MAELHPKPTVDGNDPAEAPTVTGGFPARRAVGWKLPEPGTRVGRYEVRGPLGSGGMGTVVAAWDPELARPVALKFVGGLGKSAGKDQERLTREAQAMAQLKHPNVVPIFDVGTFEERVFLAMELIDGLTLKEWAEASPRKPHQIIDLLVQVGNGLAAAHAAGIVHRDVKPANVLVDKDGRARITDFGIARVGDSETPPSPVKLESPIGDQTAFGSIVGTVGYIAPETLSGALATPAADQFALAVTACQLFTGVLPFPQVVETTVAERMRSGALKPLELHRIPRATRKVLKRALDGSPLRRYPSMAAFVKALQPEPSTRLRWAVRILAAAVLIPLYMALLGYGLTRYAFQEVVRGCRGRAVRSTLEVWGPTQVIGFSQRFGARPTAVVESWMDRWRDASLGACLTKDLQQQPTRISQKTRDCLDARLIGFGEATYDLMQSGSTGAEAAQMLAGAEDPRACVQDWSGESGDGAPWPPR